MALTGVAPASYHGEPDGGNIRCGPPGVSDSAWDYHYHKEALVISNRTGFQQTSQYYLSGVCWLL